MQSLIGDASMDNLAVILDVLGRTLGVEVEVHAVGAA